jgi:diguanylate cyclase (GGDEF)-like protein
MSGLLTIYALIDVATHPAEAGWRAASSLIPAGVIVGIAMLCRFERIPAEHAGLITGLSTILVALSVLYTVTRTDGPTELVYLNVLLVMMGACAMRPVIFGGTLAVLTAIGAAAILVMQDPAEVARRGDWFIALIVSVAASLILHRARVGGLRQLGLAQDEIERVAAIDELTGAASRYGLSLAFPWMLAQAKRQGGPLFAVFADVDGLKAVNDAYGHEAGDHLIRAAASALTRHARASDLVVRWGGDEFVVIGIGVAPDVSRFELEAATTMRERVAAITSDASLSVGLASIDSADGSMDVLIAAADADMIARRRQRGHRPGARL